jgi:hypothetical protein
MQVESALYKNNNKYLSYISKPSISMHKDPFIGYDRLDYKQSYAQDHQEGATSSTRLAELQEMVNKKYPKVFI